MKEEFAISNSTLKEIQVLKQMSHSPYIQHLLDVNYDKNAIYLILEFCEYDLSHFIRILQGDPHFHIQVSDPLKTRLQLTLDLSKSLLDLHSKGFISRDVKPSNCLITSDFHLKLADFGLATNFQILTNFSTKVATLPYKAPELCCNKSNYGAEIDIYSAGCTIFEIFTGNILIKAENEFQVIQRSLYLFGSGSFTHMCYRGLVEKNSSFEPHLEIFQKLGKIGDIVQKCVQPDFDQRPSSSQLVQMVQNLIDEYQ